MKWSLTLTDRLGPEMLIVLEINGQVLHRVRLHVKVPGLLLNLNASSLVYFSSMECSGSGTFCLNSSSRCFNSSRAVFLNLAKIRRRSRSRIDRDNYNTSHCIFEDLANLLLRVSTFKI